jgi:hypothetical protein
METDEHEMPEWVKERVAKMPQWLVETAAAILESPALRNLSDFTELVDWLGYDGVAKALENFDAEHPQPDGSSALGKLIKTLRDPRPRECPNIADDRQSIAWHDWNEIEVECRRAAAAISERLDGRGLEETTAKARTSRQREREMER